MNPPIRVNPEVYRVGDLQFIAQLRTASRAQLYAMQKVFARLGSEFTWKRAACCRAIALIEGQSRPHSFSWVVKDEWWLEP